MPSILLPLVKSLTHPVKLLVFLGLMFLGLVACQPVSQQPYQSKPPEVLGVITFFQGDVSIEPASASTKMPGLALIVAQARQQPHGMQTVQSGDRVNVAAGGSVTIICLNNQLLRIEGGISVVLSSCNGAPLPTNSQRSVAHDGGTIDVNQGSKQVVGESREKENDYGNIPIILSPRNSALIDLKPFIRWVSVKDSIEYLLSLSGPTSFDDITVAVDGLTCQEDERTKPNLVCEIPWPDIWPLAQGKRYFLTVSARTGIASQLRPSEKSSLRTISADATAKLQVNVDAIQALNADEVTKNLLLAGLYAGQGVQANDGKQSLYVEALPRYEQVVGTFPSPVLYTTLGDTYRAVDLQRYAFRAYQAAIQLLDQTEDDLAVRAAAEFGMGQVEYSRLNFKEAEPHFVKAAELYTQIGAQDELSAAQKVLEETRSRM